MKTSDDFADKSLNALTPTRLSDEEYKLYEKEFSFVFHNPKIRNIALMGTYGAGKSTVMETWDEKQLLAGDGHESTFISLAHFHGSNNETSAVEGEILNQLIHKTKRSRIPKSRFRHTQDDRRIFDFIKATACVGYGLLTIALITLLIKDDITFPENVEGFAQPIWIAICVWAIGLVAILYSAFRRDKTDKFLRRIKLFGNEVDLFEFDKNQAEKDGSESHDPIFNKYMDDVLYLLNNSGSDVYIFEDLDRFDDSIEIFEKLRELNGLANDCRLEKLKPLRFFYLVREDLFETPEDRVKFFDFIIPIIPFSDPDGNFDELRSGLSNLGLNVSDLFTYEISSFIPDPRALKDIVNEAKHYQEHIFHDSDKPLSESEAEHLVAAIVYKVVFPTDFSNFQRGKGFVSELLRKREILIAKQRRLLEAEKEELSSAIREIDEKNQFNLDELILTSYFDKSNFTRFGNAIYNANTTTEVIKAIRDNDQASKKLDEVIEEYLSDETNLKRYGEPKEYLDKRKSEYLARIQEIDDRLLHLSCSTLGKLLVESVDDDVFVIEEKDLERSADFKDCEIGTVQQSQHFSLLKHLLSTDLIDESSLRFIIRVRPGGLSLADQRNLAIIQGRRPIDPTYVFDKPGDVLMRIRDEFLMVPGVQNHSILKEILNKEETDKLSKFVAGLQRGDHADFFLGYVVSDQFIPSVFSVIENDFDNEASIVLADETASFEDRRNFVHKLMCYKDDWNLDATESALVAFANADPELLSVGDTLLEGVRRNIDKFVLSLSDIEFETADKGLLNIVYEKSLYEPNAALAMKWAENRFPYHVVNRHSAISIVYSLSDEKLHEFVEENMETFILSIIDADDSPLSESEDILAWVLNTLPDNQEAAVSFVKRLENCTFQDLSRIKDPAFKRALLLFDIPEFSETNILDYFSACENVIDDALAGFIQNHLNSEEDIKVVIDALSGNEDFVWAAVVNSNLTDENIGVLLSGEGSAALAEFNMEDLGQSRVAVVLQAKRIFVTESNAQFIRANYPSCESLFAVSDIDAYLKLFYADDDALEFDESVGLKLFESDQITPSKKVEIAKLFTSPIHLNTLYPDLLKIEIINDHFDIDDLPQLLNEFEPGGKLLQESIKNKAVARINEITAQEIPIPSGLFCEILRDPSFSANDRLEQIAFQLNLGDSLITDRECVRKCFEAVGAQDYVRLLDGKKISVPTDTSNSNVVRALMKRGMCSEKTEQGANGYIIISPKGYERK
ncbi:hypothetical protein [Adlercreutzia agrestimuris]|uniref:YobI family P-loop NTPase n=1 Tax=Adlercreutzia agrestimuris TaxID=2941324 RepID=UPI00203E0A92|nr:hypothetical protein [Adlercreutzia agrestimuris]